FFSKIAAGGHSNLALTRNGELYSWGTNTNEMEDVPAESLPAPVGASHFANGTKIEGIATSDRANAVWTNEGKVYTWGHGVGGILGHGGTVDGKDEPTLVKGVSVAGLSMGFYHVVAVGTNGQILTWGDNENGKLGYAKANFENAPQEVQGIPPVEKVAAGDGFALALTKDSHDVYGWGNNETYQLGTGEVLLSGTPRLISGLNDPGIVHIAAGASHALAASSSTVYAWGSNQSGGLGHDNGDNSNSTPAAVSFGGTEELGEVVSIAAGSQASLAVFIEDGQTRVAGWGSNSSGQLGIEPAQDSVAPPQFWPGACLSDHSAEAASCNAERVIMNRGASSLLLTRAGELFGFGTNYYSQLGAGRGSALLATKIEELEGGSILDAAIGSSHVLAVKTDGPDDVGGTVWSLGGNETGESGRTPAEDEAEGTPGQVGDLTDIQAVAAGQGFSMALDVNGDVFTWGNNTFGQLGREIGEGEYTVEGAEGPATRTPSKVPGLDKPSITQIAAGDQFAMAVDSNGTVYTWGASDKGQLGVPDRSWVPTERLGEGLQFWPAEQPGENPPAPSGPSGPSGPTGPTTAPPSGPGGGSGIGGEPADPGPGEPNRPSTPGTPGGQDQGGEVSVSGAGSRDHQSSGGGGAGYTPPGVSGPGGSARAAITRFGTRFKTVVIPAGTTATMRVAAYGTTTSASNKAKVTWKMGNKKVASVVKNAKSGTKTWKVGAANTLKVKGFKTGRTVLKLTSPGARTVVVQVKVVAKKATASVRRIKLVAPRPALKPGQSMTLRPRLTPAGAVRVSGTWSSTNPAVASVDPVGRVTAKSKGRTTIVLKVGTTRAKRTVQVK
ncbi:MAG: Ig-like domain-containing protein, partial [Bifidobacteriaceae bacterium]|nr:Ig-like domain-containing protein [Bifidobacteriaceae bacterium]